MGEGNANGLTTPTGAGDDPRQHRAVVNTKGPFYLTADEVARDYLRTSRKVVYEMARMGQLPGVVRIGRKVLFRRDRLLEFLRERESSVSSLGGPK